MQLPCAGVCTPIRWTVPLTPTTGSDAHSTSPSGVRHAERSRETTWLRGGAVIARQAGTVDDPRMHAVGGDRACDHARALSDAAAGPEPRPELLCEQFGEQVVGADVHQPEHHRQRRRADHRERSGAARCHARVVRSLGADVRGAQSERQLARRERARAERAECCAMVIGERESWPPKSGMSGAKLVEGPPRCESNSDCVADQPAGDPANARVAQLADELGCGRPVALLPDAIEGAVAERRVAAAAQVQVAVPDPVPAEMAASRAPSCAGARRSRASAAAPASCRASRPRRAGVRLSSRSANSVLTAR